MGFWIFMLCMVLLCPIIMILFGKYFSKNAPKEINALFGYRTTMSMKNKDTWKLAHAYCGNIWYKSGLILLPISIFLMLMVTKKNEDLIGFTGFIIMLLQLLPLVGVIILTEKALKKNFDENGNKKKIEKL